MTIIVKHKRSGNEYILLTASGEGDKNSLPSRFLNDLFPKEESENSCFLTLCDVKGNIFLAPANSFLVTEINGKKPSEILPELVTPPPTIRDFEEEDDFEEDSPAVAPEVLASPTSKVERDEFEDDDEDWI
jgi:hypothetical protein